MATYSKKKLLVTNASKINAIAEAIKADFERDGFEVYVDTLMSGGKDISITKGNLFKAVLGMRSALKVCLTPQLDGVFFDANVGIYGQQVIPTAISMFFFWPVLFTQIWGLIEQSSLDDRALEIAEKTIAASPSFVKVATHHKYCTNCGTMLDWESKYCSSCGNALK